MGSLAISLLMIILGQSKAWYASNQEPDLIKDVKRKIFLSPILLLTNIQIIGVCVVVLILDKYVFLYNLLAMVIFFCCLLTIHCCCQACEEDKAFKERMEIDDKEFGR